MWRCDGGKKEERRRTKPEIYGGRGGGEKNVAGESENWLHIFVPATLESVFSFESCGMVL